MRLHGLPVHVGGAMQAGALLTIAGGNNARE
jgi:hypothetical protein